MSNSLEANLIDAVKQRDSQRCVVLLQSAYDSGMSKEQAYSLLQGLRARQDIDENAILELMDIVSGWCNPAQRIWDVP